jgi:indoleamine 2,3-dioxygenase
MNTSVESIILSEFDISRSLGFLPPSPPLARLPEEYNPWEQVASDLPGLITQQGQLRKTIESLPTIETTCLTSDPQWRRAYVLLAFMTHGYVWGAGRTVATVPPALSEPFLQVCTHLGMQPVLSYAGLCLWNWQTTKSEAASSSYDLCDLRSFASFTGTADEAAFYLVPVMVEVKGGHLVARLLDAIEAGARNDWDAVSVALKHCEGTLRQMIEVLGLLNVNCDPIVFFEGIRPFLAGLEVKFARENREEMLVKCVGGSAAQSTLFMAIDSLLGVKHHSTLFQVGHSTQQPIWTKSLINCQEMRAYMPRKHRSFLEVLDKRKSLSDILECYHPPMEVRASFTSCLQALKDWRGKHIAIVSRYILLPARRAAAMADEGSVSSPLLGTGGSPLVDFLKQSRDETVDTP